MNASRCARHAASGSAGWATTESIEETMMSATKVSRSPTHLIAVPFLLASNIRSFRASLGPDPATDKHQQRLGSTTIIGARPTTPINARIWRHPARVARFAQLPVQGNPNHAGPQHAV